MTTSNDNRRRSTKIHWVTAAVAATILPCGVIAADRDLSEWIQKNLSDDYAQCAAYFFVIANTPGVPESVTTQYETMYELSLNRSINLGGEQRAVAAYKLSAESMLRTIKKDGDDAIMVLMEQHGFRCKDLMEDPQSRIDTLKRQTE